jgi:hypothetical protein
MIFKNKGLLILAICFAVVSAADVWTTVLAIENGAQEINPITNTVVLNPVALIALKIVGIACILVMVTTGAKASPNRPYIGHFALALVIGITLGAVINNVFVLHQMGILNMSQIT